MASELSGTRVAFLTVNEGVEQAELTAPWQAVKDVGGTPELIAPEVGDLQGLSTAHGLASSSNRTCVLASLLMGGSG